MAETKRKAGRRSQNGASVREVAGAPVKHGSRLIYVEQIAQGVWEERYQNGDVIVVADLTSALWRAGR